MYVRSLLRELAGLDKENNYFLYAHKDFEFDLPSPKWIKRSGAKTRYGSAWMQSELPVWLAQDRVDVFWGTQHILPLLMPSRIRAVLTVHDLVHYVFPKTMKFLNLLINKMIIPPSIHRTDVIVADSAWTLLDVKRYLNPPDKKMFVAHLGLNHIFYQRSPMEAQKILKERFGLTSPFLLTVGTFEPRKNIAGILEAFSLIADAVPHHLAVVGQSGWKNKDVMDRLMKSKICSRVHMLGYVEDGILPYVYSAADIFVFPSLYEGFGLPPLEAMACGVPVVASNVSSIPEVVGDAALLVDPNDPKQIAARILEIVENESLRHELIFKGLNQAAKFKWEKTAKKMLDIFSMFNGH